MLMCMCVCLNVCLCSQKLEEVVRSPGTTVTGGCHELLRLNLCPLEKQLALLTAEFSFHITLIYL